MNKPERDDDPATKAIKEQYAKLGDYPTKFRDHDTGTTFRESKRIREFLCRALDADIVRVYCMESTRPDYALYGTDAKPWALDLSSETYYIITKSGNILRLTNSEWGQLRIADNMKED